MGFGLIFLFEWIVIDTKLWNWRLWARTALFGLPTIAFFTINWIIHQNADGDGGGLRTVKDFTYHLTMLDAHLISIT